MRKSKNIFMIMAVIYCGVAVLGEFEYLTISDNILIGLSLSALLSSISDILYNLGCKRMATNEFSYIIHVTMAFLDDKISHNICVANPNINIRNVRLTVEQMCKDHGKAIHPNEYCKKRYIGILGFFSQVGFVLSLGVFILVPFLPAFSKPSFSTFLTLSAFSTMCVNLHISEEIADMATIKNNFMNQQQLIIQTAYPDFSNMLTAQLYYYEDYVATTNTQESDPNAHT